MKSVCELAIVVTEVFLNAVIKNKIYIYVLIILKLC